MKVGGNLFVLVKNFDVKNVMGMDVGNMCIDVENVSFEGVELNNWYFFKGWLVGIGI